MFINAEPEEILSTPDNMHAAEAAWDRLSHSDLARIRTKAELAERIEERYCLAHDDAVNEVEVWASGQRFGVWRA